MSDTEENQAFVIGEGEMAAPEELVNTSDAPMPIPQELPDLPELPAAPPIEESAPIAEAGSLDLPDMDMDVDDLLAQAVVPEEVEPQAEAASEPTQKSHFNLLLESISAEQGKALQDLLKDLGLKSESQRLLPKLSEYEAVRLAQFCAHKGILFELHYYSFGQEKTEEDLALGPLAGFSETPPLQGEGAPKVLLPEKETEVPFLEAEPATVIVLEKKGIVTAHRSLARRFFREDEAALLLAKEMDQSLPSSRFEQLFRQMRQELQKRCLQMGGNAILGIRLEAFPETRAFDSQADELRLVAFGTAAVVENLENFSLK